MYDLIIRNGTIVDGTGKKPFEADLAVKGERVVAIGEHLGESHSEIDAQGLLVTPGWVDVHTHYDGQVTWDPEVSPSGTNGVTTVIMGNCGVGFAPVRPGQEDFLINLMEGVEDIPGSALSLGIKWDWESFPEYLTALENTARVADVAVHVPHGPVRAYVMGDRGAQNEEATPEDIEAMYQIVKEGIEAGAVGFTSSRVLGHKSSTGECVPGTFAGDQELFGILRALSDTGQGVFGVASGSVISGDFTQDLPIPNEDEEIFRLRRLAEETGRPVMFACVQSTADPEQWKRMLQACDEAAKEGIELIPQVSARPAGLLAGFDGSIHPFSMCPSFQPLLSLSPKERSEALHDPKLRAKLLSEEPDTSTIPAAVSFIYTAWHMMFEFGDPPNYEPEPSTSLAAIAAETGTDPKELAYDIMLKGDYLYLPIMDYVDGNMDVVLEKMKHEKAIFGLGDGGAHCGFITDASICTFLLTHWVRDRTRGPRVPLEWVVEQQTRATAQLYGMHDRGVLAEGMLADINIIDLDGLTLRKPKMAFDLPGDERRLIQEVEGYRYTIKRGTITFEDNVATGATPGALVRGPQPA